MLQKNHGTILIGWELGSGLGHIMRLRPIIERLLGIGYNIVAAVRDRFIAGEVLQPLLLQYQRSLDLVQAPIFVHKSMVRETSISLFEVMRDIGFASQCRIEPILGGWHKLINRYNPVCILADFAPTLYVAARGKIPVLTVGNGHAVPPAQSPMRGPITCKHASTAADQEICRTLNMLTPDLPPLCSITDALRGDHVVLCSPRALDPYHATRTDTAYWPPELNLTDRRVCDVQTHDVLIYLPKHHLSIDHVLTSVESIGARSIAYLGKRLCKSFKYVTVSEEPLDLGIYIKKSSVVVHHGGFGISSLALAHHKKQIILPVDFEKVTTAKLIARALCCTTVLEPHEYPLMKKVLIEKILQRNPLPVMTLSECSHFETLDHICQTLLALETSRTSPGVSLGRKPR